MNNPRKAAEFARLTQTDREEYIVLSASIPEDILYIAVKDLWWRVRKRAAARRELTNDMYDDLAKDSDARVVRELTCNPKVPNYIIEKLTLGGNIRYASYAAKSNFATKKVLLACLSREITSISMSVVHNLKASEDVLIKALDSHWLKVRCAVAELEYASEKVLIKAASDSDRSVIIRAVYNLNATGIVVQTAYESDVEWQSLEGVYMRGPQGCKIWR